MEFQQDQALNSTYENNQTITRINRTNIDDILFDTKTITTRCQPQKAVGDIEPLPYPLPTNLNSSMTTPKTACQKKEELSKCWRFWAKFDIFNFVPFPRADEITSQQSQCGSLILFFLFITFAAFASYSFLFNSSPRVLTYQTLIDFDAEYPAQEFAFGFYTLNSDNPILVNDPTILTYYLEQYSHRNPDQAGRRSTKTSTTSSDADDQSRRIEFELCEPEWSSIKIDMFCPKEKLILRGVQGTGDYIKFPRLQILECNQNTNPSIICDQTANSSIFPKGRLMIFLRKEGRFNYAANTRDSDSGSYSFNFIVPTLDNQAESAFMLQQIIINPNYFTSFTPKIITILDNFNSQLQLSYSQEQFQRQLQMMSSEPSLDQLDRLNLKELNSFYPINSQNLRERKLASSSIQPIFCWQMTLNPEKENVLVEFQTSIFLLSLLGGMWGFLLRSFMLIFFKYNQKKFYQSHITWKKFEVHLPAKQVMWGMSRFVNHIFK